MSLYDGIIDNVNEPPISKQSKHSTDEDEHKGGWSQAGLKLLQSQIQLKKAQATLAQRDKQRIVTQPSSSIGPVVDLTSKKEERISRFDSPKKETPSLLKPRKPLVLDGPPLSFIPVIAKEESVVIFGEIVVEDEYNPLYPNDYEKCVAKREAEKKRLKEEQRKREREGLSRDKLQMDEEIEYAAESKKRIMGAAIAPPPALVEQDRKVLEEPASFTPDFGAGSKGLGVAAKIMEKYGYKQGTGLGRSGQGMSTALRVEKVGEKEGKIIHEKDMFRDDEPDDIALMPPPSMPIGMNVNLTPLVSVGEPAPITEILKNPSKLVLLRNMVGPGEVDGELDLEVREEMLKYGEVVKCMIYEMPKPVADNEAVRIFVEFPKVDQAIKAVVDLNGRYFGGRMVRATFYDTNKLALLDLTAE